MGRTMLRFHSPTKTVNVTLTSAELAQIASRAREDNQPVTRFLRRVALGAIGARGPILHQLALVGRDLDRMVRLLTDGGAPDVAGEVRLALERHRTLVEHLLKGRPDSTT
jgi:hypothetical protein